VPTLAVIAPEDTFASVWPELGRDHDLEVLVLPSASELSSGRDLLQVIVVAAGRESEAEAGLHALRAAGMVGPIVVGAAADHRTAVRMLHAGASEYLVLPQDLATLGSLVGDLRARRDRGTDRQQLLEAT